MGRDINSFRVCSKGLLGALGQENSIILLLDVLLMLSVVFVHVSSIAPVFLVCFCVSAVVRFFSGSVWPRKRESVKFTGVEIRVYLEEIGAA